MNGSVHLVGCALARNVACKHATYIFVSFVYFVVTQS